MPPPDPSAPSRPAPPTQLQPPPSPRTHRTLRRLQSAHTLGSKAASQSSLITQQRLREQHTQLQHIQLHPPQHAAAAPRTMSPVKRDVSASYGPRTSPQRARERAGSEGEMRRSGFRRPAVAHMSLPMQQLIRDGPPDGDFVGALEAARYKILDEGIKSDSDGMVSPRRTPPARNRT